MTGTILYRVCSAISSCLYSKYPIGTPRGSSPGSRRSLSLIPSSYSQVCDSSFCFWMLRDNPLSAGLGHKKPLVPKQFPSEFPEVSQLGPRGSFPPFSQQTLKLATLLFVRYCVVTVRVKEWVTFNLKH